MAKITGQMTSRSSVIEMLEQDIKEVREVAARSPNAWVVCCGDCIPFRLGEDGRLSVTGGQIWSGTQRHARQVARELNAEVQANEALRDRYSVCAMPSTGWSCKRVEQLTEQLEAAREREASAIQRTLF